MRISRFRASVGALVALAALASGCGSGDGSGAGPGVGPGGVVDHTSDIAGSWLRLIGTTCAEGWTFNLDHTYAEQVLCLDTSLTNTANDEIAGGTFTVTADRIFLTPTKTSCPSRGYAAGSVTYAATRTSLTLVFTNAVNTYDSIDSSGGTMGGASLILGCWNDDGTFTTHDLVSI